ncbi:MAG: hypothetical protein ACFFDB_02845 [Promethearchaeota archaeon]
MFLLSFTLIVIVSSGLISKVYAGNFNLGVRQNENIIWKCGVCNKAEMENVFGMGWDNSGVFKNLNKGMRMKWKINSTEINNTIFTIKYDIWNWNLNQEWGVKDNTSQVNIYVNPMEYSTNLSFLNYTSLVPFFLPIPIGAYIGGLSLKLNEWYDIDNRVLPTINVEIFKDGINPGYPNKNIKIVAIYNDYGVLNSYKLYGKDNTVIIDIYLDFLPFYVIPTLIILVAALLIGLGYYLFRNRIHIINSCRNNEKENNFTTD